ncbi:uncharacterized protein PF3D7_1120000-like [Montipora capricornis]|uniref:uncharacterized protein PF3D7_1120000-like n=1 Tax=Montipora capricornis TaxID=246305 RepID=UPI0035F14889
MDQWRVPLIQRFDKDFEEFIDVEQYSEIQNSDKLKVIVHEKQQNAIANKSCDSPDVQIRPNTAVKETQRKICFAGRNMGLTEPMEEDKIDAQSDKDLKHKSRIYGKDKPDANLTEYQRAVNDVSYQIVQNNQVLLVDRRELMKQAQAQVQKTYTFKKGYSRSASADNNQQKKTETCKQEKTFKEERAIRHMELTEKIKETKNMIRYKTLRRDKCASAKEWKACEMLSDEIKKLLSEKGQLERELVLLVRKQKKNQWWEKTGSSEQPPRKRRQLIHLKQLQRKKCCRVKMISEMHLSEESTSESKIDDKRCSGGEQETAIDSSQQLHSDDSKHHDHLQEHELQANEEDNQQEHQQAGFRDNHELPLSKQRSTTGEMYMNANQLFDMLRAYRLNWMPFVELLKTEIPSVTSEALDQLLLDFASQLPYLDLKENEEHLIEESRQVNLMNRRMDEMNDENVVSESEEWINVNNVLGAERRELISKKVKSLRKQATSEATKKIEAERFLKRKRSKHVGTILKKYPYIGNDTENFVKSRGVGTEARRRTGLLTFDGNRKKSQTEKLQLFAGQNIEQQQRANQI